MRLFAIVVSLALCLPRAVFAGDLEAATGKLVDRWLEAQNKGDFATYQSLYANRFTGIRRSGPRTARLDRAGWMRDRARMFKSPMQVSATDRKIAAASTVVTFTQTWQSGTYKDVGPKRLVIVVEKGAPKIAREELLASNLEKPAPFRDRLSFVLDDKWVLIDDEVADETIATGDATFVPGTNAQTSWKRVNGAALDLGKQTWKGRKVTVWGKSGKPCTTTVTGFQVVSRAYVHFGQLEEWKDKSPAEIAPLAWELGSKQLMGVLAPGCKDIGYARDASLPAPTIVVASKPTEAQRALAMAALHKLPRYVELQKNFPTDAGKTVGGWERNAEGAVVDVGVFVYGTRTWISVTATAGEGCGGWSGDVWGLFEVVGDKLVLRNKPGSGPTVTPTHAVDTDGDGAPEFLYDQPWWELGTDRGMVRPHSDRNDEHLKLAAPFNDCPC